MISNALIMVGTGLLRLFALVLPASDGLPSGFAAALSDFFQKAYSFNSVLPIDTLLQVFGLFVAFEIGILTFRFVRWFFSSVPLSPIKNPKS